jgi:hypothetical protein
MKLRWSNRIAGPLAVVGVAIVIVAIAYRNTSWVSDFGPIDLRSGASQSVTFKAGYSELYGIGLQMDQQAAKRLFPCLADPDWFSGRRASCEGGGQRAWPVKLSFMLSADGEDITGDVRADTGDAGGEYGGQDTYTWQPAYVRLQQGKNYRLVVHSVSDGSALSAAHPRLVVGVVTGGGFLEGLMLQHLAALFLAGVLVLAAAVWAAVGRVNSRKRFRTVG